MRPPVRIGGGVSAARGAGGLLNLIHTNNSPKPVLARLCGHFGLSLPLLFPRGADAGNITG